MSDTKKVPVEVGTVMLICTENLSYFVRYKKVEEGKAYFDISDEMRKYTEKLHGMPVRKDFQLACCDMSKIRNYYVFGDESHIDECIKDARKF